MKLNQLRKEIDKIDLEFLKLIKKRDKIVKQVFKYKSQHNLSLKDKFREKEIIKQTELNSLKLNLDPKVTKQIIKKIINKNL